MERVDSMEKMNNMEYVFFEIDEILNNMPLSYSEKIPQKLKHIINKNKINNGFIYNSVCALHEQEMLSDTKTFLSILYRLYWCSDENKKGKF